MGKSLDEEFVRGELAKEGWILLNGYKTDSTPLIIHNPNRFNGCLCKILYMTWRSGSRPAMESIIDKTEYVRLEFLKEGWELLSEYTKASEPLLLRHPDKFDGHICKIKLGNWNFGKRPDFRSLVNKTEFVRDQLKKEGWELLNECRISSDRLLMRNPNFFDGVICQMMYNTWQQGARPNSLSIVDRKTLIKKYLAKEGWNLVKISEKDTDQIIITKEDFYEEALVRISWCNWLTGRRPNLMSLEDPTTWVNKILNREGWILVSEYKKSGDHIIIFNPNKLDGFQCRTSLRYGRWDVGRILEVF
jgi:hypothetical protein